jgi:hypothetical protein
MDIEILRERVRAGNYLVKSHAVQHALKEGFERKHIVEAILNGRIIEEYPDNQRVLGNSGRKFGSLPAHRWEYANPVYAEFVTAYIPDESQWSSPPFRRRRQK